MNICRHWNSNWTQIMEKFVAYLTPCLLHWQSVVGWVFTQEFRCYTFYIMSDGRSSFFWTLFAASRGVACVFSSRRHALVYILDEDEDEDEVSDMEWLIQCPAPSVRHVSNAVSLRHRRTLKKEWNRAVLCWKRSRNGCHHEHRRYVWLEPGALCAETTLSPVFTTMALCYASNQS